ncbi:nitrous oxide reductase family maturation protein NosD [Marinobacteraceae bacterium S3BR75-40.1]
MRVFVVLSLFWAFGAALAQPTLLQPEDGTSTVTLAAGEHGALRIETPGLTVTCEPGAIIDAQGKGNAVVLAAPKIRIEGCQIRNWGRSLSDLDSGIFVEREASGAEIVGNRLQGPGFGLWLDSTPEVTVKDNRIEGETSLRSQDRGNGIHLHNTTHARIVGNEVWHTRDGVYIETANNNLIKDNRFHDLRYGVHYMYSHSNRIIGNHTRNTRTGYALMQSKRLTVIGNTSENDQNYGILMNYITDSEIRDNTVRNVSQGTSGGENIQGAEGKAVFIYNSVYNTITGNRFSRSDLGIHLTAGSEDNKVYGNAFIANQQQVKYVATRPQEWSYQGKGNFWSDYLGWDRDQDGIGDVPYEPNDNVDRLLWKYPEARVLMHSPAVDTLRWVQRAFPVVRAQGVKDSHPLMRPPQATEKESP